MASLPQKGTVGENFKTWSVNAINQLIDYLNAMRVRKGTGIEVSETPSGVIVSLAKPQTQTPQVASAGGGGGASYGIETTIDGSTASIALVEGGTASSISLIPTAPVTLSAGANGELIIGSTASSGGGMRPPDYDHTNTVIVSSSSTLERTYNEDVWLIGSAQVQFGEYDNDTNSVVLHIGTIYAGYHIADGSIAYGSTVPSPYDTITIGAAFCYFLPAGTRFFFTITGNGYVTCEVHPTLP